MIGFCSTIKYYLCTKPVNIHNSFDGLAGIVRDFMQKTPTSGAVFIFINRQKTHLKMLYWDGDGFVIYYKRLERGRYKARTTDCKDGLELKREDVLMLLEGLSIDNFKKSKRYKIA
jgi:transposase